MNSTGTAKTPRVLLVTAFRWITSVRAALEFNHAGYDVHVIGPRWQDFAAQSYVERYWSLNPFRPQVSLRRAIAEARPDLIVPLDDCARQYLNSVQASPKTETATRSVIANSLGESRHFDFLYNRAGVSEVAGKLDLHVPTTLPVNNLDELAVARHLMGFPVVLKTDGSWGGQGVDIVADETRLRQSYDRLKAPPSLARALWRMFRKSDFALLGASLRRAKHRLSLQKFVDGRPANASVACWQGEVLASVVVEVFISRGATGPSTVVRLIDHPDISKTVSALVRHFGLSGLYGFDFMLTADDRAAFVEINPRATPTFHLVSNENRLLLKRLKMRLTGEPEADDILLSQTGMISLFPQEIMRDPESSHVRDGYHDIPHFSPDFIALAHKLTSRRFGQWNETGANDTDLATPAPNQGT